MKLVRIKPNEAVAISKLECEFYGTRWVRYAAWWTRESLDEGYGIKAVGGHGSKFRGAVILCRKIDGSYYISSLFVMPFCRRIGVGSALLKAALSRISSNCRVELMVAAENEAAIHLYKKFGFRQIDRIGDYWVKGKSAIRMRRKSQEEAREA